jgi:hypothetical protein
MLSCVHMVPHVQTENFDLYPSHMSVGPYKIKCDIFSYLIQASETDLKSVYPLPKIHSLKSLNVHFT